ncbi:MULTISPECIES: hypothetical protein [Sorangium]|uniref:Uncharacterized protein n=1 Tax=Sorangium cellulosum TaxID=56 RepID=A0A4P2QU09_SORCE|nr:MULTISPECIES: hypothetical protein [Sorangium]AUX33844.1 uncharacterized protein SOCE836_060080 [Sorangium cellulosum]WCQ93152.1 hypothetical protein NQZ70_05900 [Sorangium sp. Soce836]
MNRLAHRKTIAALALLAAACGGSSDDAPDDGSSGTTASGAGGGTTASGAGGGTTASGAGGGTTASSGTTAPDGEILALEIVEWHQDESALRVSLVLRNQDTLPLPVTPESFSVTSSDGFSLGWVPFRWITNPCPAVNLPSLGSLRCEMGFSKSAEQEPARLVFAALDGRQIETPFPAESPITLDNFCSHISFDGRCYECVTECRLYESVCTSDEDRINLDRLLFSAGDSCTEDAPPLSEACFDGLLTCIQDDCVEDCDLHP